MKPIVTLSLTIALVTSASLSHGEAFPDFSRDYWQNARKSAEGKRWRGIALGALGVASIAPTSIFIYKATGNPQKFLAYSVVSSIATLGMTFHGFFSIRAGIKERDKADSFIAAYDEGTVSLATEQETYLDQNKTSAIKVLIFGGALIVQSAALLANGIVLGVRKKNGADIGGIKIWPSYLLGGLLLAGGSAIVIGKSITLRSLNQLEVSSEKSATAAVAFEPLIQVDPTTGETSFGMSGHISF
jgi:hypothetical protein